MPCPSLMDRFSALEDPRQSWKVLFLLPEVLLLVLCGTLAGAEDFVEIRRWGQMHGDFLRRLLPFKAGIPSHDTLNDVLNAIDGTLFAQCFTAWVEGLRAPVSASAATPEVVAIDGKTSRRTHDRGKDRGPLHMVSAWASGQRLVLSQQACQAKSNEITAIPLLLERLALTGALVTIDAMGTQTKIAQAILNRGGDYLLAVKDNQPSLHDEIRRYLNDKAAVIHSQFETTDGNHGRIEVRRHLVSHDVDWLTTARRFPGEPRFPGLRAIRHSLDRWRMALRLSARLAAETRVSSAYQHVTSERSATHKWFSPVPENAYQFAPYLTAPLFSLRERTKTFR